MEYLNQKYYYLRQTCILIEILFLRSRGGGGGGATMDRDLLVELTFWESVTVMQLIKTENNKYFTTDGTGVIYISSK